MRLVSYNILDGGAGRADALASVIRSRDPDVVAVVEAEDPGVVDAIARSLGMTAVQALGNSHASALLTRWTIRHSINHALFRPALTKSLLEASVISPGGAEWTIGVVHLHARASDQDERRREVELAEVLDAFAPHRAAGLAHLLCGDFNANAPYQRIDPARCKPRTRQEWEANGGDLPRRVVQKLLDAGYRDALRDADPRAAEHAATFTTEFPGQGVDYVFTFGLDPRRVVAAWVHDSDAARSASDHFPIGAEIRDD
jgi:endonuclease/exonuclease/phosphatase family metal-dependent hydrolase